MPALPQPALHGVLPVFQTPYHPDESIDFDTLARELDWLFVNGADGVVMAMVSETLRLSTEERREMAAFVCRAADGRGTSVISVGAESSKVACDLARHAEECGATALMAIPPVATQAGEDSLREYYARIIRSVGIPVVVQDASNYVGRPMSIELQAGLLREFGADRVFYKPEATPVVERLVALRAATNGAAVVFEGQGGIALIDTFKHGIAGTMPGADLIKAIVALWSALKRSDGELASLIHQALVRLIALQPSLDTYLQVEKRLLVRQSVFSSPLVRGPMRGKMPDHLLKQADDRFDELMAAIES